jgi:hypothetical protein
MNILAELAAKLPTWAKLDNVGQTAGLLLLMNQTMNISTTDQMMIIGLNSAIHGFLHDTSCAIQKQMDFNAM